MGFLLLWEKGGLWECWELTVFTISSVQFSSVAQSRVWLFATPWITARQASLSITNSRSSPYSATKPRNSGFPVLWFRKYCFNDLHGSIIIVSMIYKSESEVAQSCLTLCDPMDCSLRGSSVHGIFQARVLEWVAIAFSSQWSIRSHSYCFHDLLLHKLCQNLVA